MAADDGVSISTRLATAEDMPAVAELFKRTFQKTYPHFPELHTVEEDVEYFSAVVFAKDRVQLALHPQSGELLGFIAFNPEMVNHLYVAPEAAGQGIGRHLLEFAKAQRRTLRLWTFQCNEAAQSFYAKQGFKVVQMTDGAHNEERQPDVLLEWNPVVGESG